jgi:hypothetical protein
MSGAFRGTQARVGLLDRHIDMCSLAEIITIGARQASVSIFVEEEELQPRELLMGEMA